MAVNNSAILRVRCFTPDVQPLYCVLSFEVDSNRKTVRPSAVAGRADNFHTLKLDCAPPEMTAWLEEVRYYGRTDPRITADLERCLKRLLSDASFADRLLESIEKRDLSPIDFALNSELEHILGARQLAKESFFGVAGPAPAAASAERTIPMHFMMAPLNGVPLLRLALHQSVAARFADLKDPATRAFLESLPEEERKSKSFEVKLVSLREARDVGPEAVRAVVHLPGGIAAEVVEENRYIRVRLAGSGGAEAAQRKRDAAETAIPFARFELPAWAIFGAAFLLMTVLATLLLSLL